MELKTGRLPDSEISRAFLQGVVNRRAVGFHKYGSISRRDENYPSSIQNRLQLYLQDGNTEWLIDVATYAMLEFMNPKHPHAHYRAQSADESPGNVLLSGSREHGDTPPVFHSHEGD